ncbi:MAG: DUF1559 domain-containing protein [Planctomycetia bacterium]|nr:DUF1559 domain-containing protein [Planctomycetia bacterium]
MRCNRQAFTLVEVLTVISIIGMLLALLLPAVQAAREAGRGTVCRNNLRQIAIACETYHVTHGNYPPGQMWGPYGLRYDSTAWSFLARLLPHLERQDLYEAGGIPDKTLRESGIAHYSLAVLRCPSDGTPGPSLDRGNLEGIPIALTSFKGVSGANWGADGSQNLGPGEVPTLWPNPGTNGSWDGLDEGDGMFYRSDYKVRRTHAHVLDGLSNTFMLGEDLPEWDAYCSWPYANNAYSTCAIPPNQRQAFDAGDWPNVQGFRSNHPTGLNFAFADCHVQFVRESIALDVYRSLATIKGKELVSVPQ